ncbi:hypothetical protein GCM10025866_31820 [Naasia aerilata]|uniref:Uncharacterized protein n=1 Tax=Naasia aerilata TaxID=1162966 RepID=A0ABM8GFZ6_9MICO|nr:hypothetical protein GCM10025866_31820 [Naasia aerilata]
MSAFSGPFEVGDRVQLTGPKGRLNTITLAPGKQFHSHRGVLEHEALIGLPDGSVVANSGEWSTSPSGRCCPTSS